ncbi:U-scoloptoxin(01)-Tl1a [Pseudolycoriella hygida]|uniref:U-scoloptoxin(01)-Tl1a n=1 Tax=Pseudolycoriella hygida TaxID=35572 RepID=A0A9Q0RXG9_9DIPT|nr:U-scoloptoxin(01)-Tl1a [Pseudolycoriella hygida]
MVSGLLLLSILLFAANAQAAPPNCANYPPSYFVNDDSNCQAYWYCANASSQPQPGMCSVPYNFNQAGQVCDHPTNFPCSVTPPAAPPNCANYPPSYFINDNSNCQAYWYSKEITILLSDVETYT